MCNKTPENIKIKPKTLFLLNERSPSNCPVISVIKNFNELVTGTANDKLVWFKVHKNDTLPI